MAIDGSQLIFLAQVSIGRAIRLVFDVIRTLFRFIPGIRREQDVSDCPIVTCTIRFSNLGISSLTDTLRSETFQLHLQEQMAKAGNISESDVAINSIIPSGALGKGCYKMNNQYRINKWKRRTLRNE